MANKKKHRDQSESTRATSNRHEEETGSGHPPGMKRKEYEHQMRLLHGELVAVQEWVKSSGAKICIVFEGRDTAGKGGTIKRITERVSPRVFRVVALPAPSEREKSQMYLQRYVQHLPAAGEVAIFDRSWYNRAGVERVMGFCTPEETARFLDQVPAVEKAMVDSRILLLKYWLEVSADEQTRRLESRLHDPRKIWKLSDMDLKSYSRWDDYSKARDAMFRATDTAWAPWYIANTDDKQRGRLNIISHVLSQIPYQPLTPPTSPCPDARDRAMTSSHTSPSGTSPPRSRGEVGGELASVSDGEVVLLALATAVNPTLLAVTTVMLLLPHPERLMLGYWAGAMVVSVSLGLAIVFALNDSGVVSTTKQTLSPVGDFVLAGIMLICALLLARRDKEEQQGRRTRRPKSEKAPRWQEALDKRASAKVTFVLGVLLSLPGFTYLIGLNAITELHYSDAAIVVVVIGFNLVQFVLIEGPIVAFKVAPERTPAGIEQAKAALRTHGRSYGARGLLVLAALLAMKGAIAIA